MNGSTQRTASGTRSATGPAIQPAMSQDTSSICLQRYSPSRRKSLDGLAVTTGRGPHQPARVVINDHGQIALTLAMRDLLYPDPAQTVEQIGLSLASTQTRSQIAPTVRHATRISSATADLLVLTASHAAWSSNARVNRESCLAHGTAQTTTP